MAAVMHCLSLVRLCSCAACGPSACRKACPQKLPWKGRPYMWPASKALTAHARRSLRDLTGVPGAEHRKAALQASSLPLLLAAGARVEVACGTCNCHARCPRGRQLCSQEPFMPPPARRPAKSAMP